MNSLYCPIRTEEGERGRRERGKEGEREGERGGREGREGERGGREGERKGREKAFLIYL